MGKIWNSDQQRGTSMYLIDFFIIEFYLTHQSQNNNQTEVEEILFLFILPIIL